jgi:hypothetical protein
VRLAAAAVRVLLPCGLLEVAFSLLLLLAGAEDVLAGEAHEVDAQLTGV